MNLRQIASPAIQTIVPATYCIYRQSTGYTTRDDGFREATFQDFPGISIDVQALSYTDLMKMDGLNIEGTRRKVYIGANSEGIDRNAIKGGDLIVMPNLSDFPGPTEWLVVQVLEHWPGWSSIAITLQVSRS